MKEVINYPKKRVMVLSNQALGGKNNYWNYFYKSDISKSLVGHSKFAEFALMALKKTFYADSMSKVITLLDIGCGNGRDLYYLRENGIDAHGIDLNSCDNSIYITHGNALNISETYDVYYLRFFVHTLEESELDDLLDNILYLMHKESYIFIETRSSKTITDTEKSETNFRSKIGEEHFRMLYSIDYLSDKIKKNFNINYSTEDKSLAPFRGEDPYVIRMILSKK
ncbi:class I SAM-dependent methyltransferase [bacterium]|nr:class I SAM-dependent methyltransferase [bacterium]